MYSKIKIAIFKTKTIGAIHIIILPLVNSKKYDPETRTGSFVKRYVETEKPYHSSN